MTLYLKRLPEIEYLEPESVNEACLLLRQYNGEAKVIAGGTDLLIQMKNRALTPKYLINLKKISGLGEIIYSDTNGLRIGSAVKLRAIESSPLVKEKFTALFEAACNMASIQIRNLATIGGNLCNALPSADTGEEALDLIDVDYEILPSVFDQLEAIREGVPQIHDHVKNNRLIAD